MDECILASEALKFVFCSNEVISSIFLEILDYGLCETNVGVETSTNCGAALGNLVYVFK